MRWNNTLCLPALLALLVFVGGCAPTSNLVAAEQTSTTLQGILSKGELVVGTAGSMPPLNMTDKEGKVIGFEIDMATIMAQTMGVNLKVETMPFADLLPALEAGKVDMVLSGMTITPERNLRVAFIGPYIISGKCFLSKAETIAKAEEASDINTPDTRLAALAGSTSEKFVKTLISKATLTTVKDYDEGVALVLNDKVNAMVADFPLCAVSLVRYPDAGLVSGFSLLTYEPLGIALPGNDPLLLNWVTNFLGRMEGTGTLELMKDRWIEDASWIEQLN
jgi:polar amino acid transport system substrate-binding protein